MKTEVLRVDTEDREKIISVASNLLKSGELVAIPTETVYGLAGNALLSDVAEKIFKTKGRPSDNPLIVHISEISQLYPLVKDVPKKAMVLAEHFWPGPLTMIFKKSELIPDSVSGGLDTVAIRLPDCEITRQIIEKSCPLAAPSANLSGSPSPTTANHVFGDLNGKIPLIVDGGECRVGVESTVITFATDIPTILRPGGVTKEQIEAVIGDVVLHSAVINELESEEKATSPGMKYRHYAPKKKLVLLDCNDKDFIKYLNIHRFENIGAIVFDEDVEKLNIPCLTVGKAKDVSAHAHNLFDVLRKCDALDCDTVYARLPQKSGLSLAVYNRMIRAAAHNIIKPKMPKIIGFTGPSGAGKSLIASHFAQKGYKIIDADKIARQVVEKGSDTLENLVAEFGKEILFSDGTLNRARLSEIAFATPKKTEKLNSITHPAIIKNIIEEITVAGQSPIILDAPLLFEGGLQSLCDKIIGITAPIDERINRVAKRDNISQEKIRLRFSAGKSDDYYREKCDIIINNTDLEKSVKAIEIRTEE